MNKTLASQILAVSLLASPAIADENPILAHQKLGSGPEKVIVLHDWMGDAENYTAVQPWLDADIYTYVFADVRGYGKSKGLSGSYTSNEIADDVMTLANHLGWKNYNLVGHSMNGMAGFKALLLDWKADKRIQHFIAVTPVTPDGYPASEDDKAFLTAAMTDDNTAAAAFGALTGNKLNKSWGIRKTARTRENANLDAVRAYYKMWVTEDFSAEFKAAEIETPVLVIGGRNDLPGFQQEHYDKTLAKWLPNISFAYIENAGHYPMNETPVLFAKLIEEHLSSSLK